MCGKICYLLANVVPVPIDILLFAVCCLCIVQVPVNIATLSKTAAGCMLNSSIFGVCQGERRHWAVVTTEVLALRDMLSHSASRLQLSAVHIHCENIQLFAKWQLQLLTFFWHFRELNDLLQHWWESWWIVQWSRKALAKFLVGILVDCSVVQRSEVFLCIGEATQIEWNQHYHVFEWDIDDDQFLGSRPGWSLNVAS